MTTQFSSVIFGSTVDYSLGKLTELLDMKEQMWLPNVQYL